MKLKAALVAILLSHTPAATQASSMENWISRVLPSGYPRLIEEVKKSGPLTVEWRAQSGDLNSVKVLYLVNNLTIVGAFPVTSASGEILIDFYITDTDLDGHPDEALYHVPNNPKLVKPPFDEATKFTWYSSLAIVFRQTRCCT